MRTSDANVAAAEQRHAEEIGEREAARFKAAFRRITSLQTVRYDETAPSRRRRSAAGG
ncbi:hypothetical protein PV392_05240 [Streptomyces sp. ME03-5709C]|nr:hypothetical protein [Streptomyces sp. ME03-5709C]